jgi:hypothetical protein
MGSNKKTERDVDNFCSWIEVQVMTELIGALPSDKQAQVIPTATLIGKSFNFNEI